MIIKGSMHPFLLLILFFELAHSDIVKVKKQEADPVKVSLYEALCRESAVKLSGPWGYGCKLKWFPTESDSGELSTTILGSFSSEKKEEAIVSVNSFNLFTAEQKFGATAFLRKVEGKWTEVSHLDAPFYEPCYSFPGKKKEVIQVCSYDASSIGKDGSHKRSMNGLVQMRFTEKGFEKSKLVIWPVSTETVCPGFSLSNIRGIKTTFVVQPSRPDFNAELTITDTLRERDKSGTIDCKRDPQIKGVRKMSLNWKNTEKGLIPTEKTKKYLEVLESYPEDP